MISGRDENKNAIQNMLNFLGQEEKDLNTRYTKEIIMLQHLIKTNIAASLGEKAKYFDVRIEPRGNGVEISVVTNSPVGSYIYRGTASHDIISSSYQAMPMPDGRFARSARHPGTQPMKEEIDQAIMSALRTSGMM